MEWKQETGMAVELRTAAAGQFRIAPPTPRRALREKSSWEYLRFPEAAVTEDLPAVLRTIEQAVERLGGPARAS